MTIKRPSAEDKATAARLADDPRGDAPAISSPFDVWRAHNRWVCEVQEYLHTLAAQPDDAAAGDAKYCGLGHAWEIISNDEDGVVWRCSFCGQHMHEGRKKTP